MNTAISKQGSGAGLDGIDPSIFSIVPENVKNCLQVLFNLIFGKYYPEK